MFAFNVPRSNHAIASGSQNRNDDFGKSASKGGEIARVGSEVAGNARFLFLNCGTGESLTRGKLGVFRSAGTTPADDGDQFRAHIVNADPAIFAKFSDQFGKAFGLCRTITATHREGANLVERVVDDYRHARSYFRPAYLPMPRIFGFAYVIYSFIILRMSAYCFST